MKQAEQEFDPAIPLSKLSEHPANPRRGDDMAVAESVEAHGFFGAVLVQRSTGYVVAGNTRLRVAQAEGADRVPWFWLDVDDETAKRILLVDNRASDLAFYDDPALVALLGELRDSGTLDGTGYDTVAYELLLQQTTGQGDMLGGVREGDSALDRAGIYEAADIRSIILPFPGPQYERVVDQLGSLRAQFDADTNSQVVARLLDDATDAT